VTGGNLGRKNSSNSRVILDATEGYEKKNALKEYTQVQEKTSPRRRALLSEEREIRIKNRKGRKPPKPAWKYRGKEAGGRTMERHGVGLDHLSL